MICRYTKLLIIKKISMKSTHIREGVYKTTTMKIPPSTNKD